MTTICKRFSIKALDTHCRSSVAKAMYQHWKKAKDKGDGDFDALTPYSSELLVMGYPMHNSPLSNLLICGANTMAAKVFGSNWVARAAEERNKFAEDYSHVVAKGQSESMEANEAVYDLISTHVGDAPMIYERLLMPVKTTGGMNLLMCHSMPISLPDFVKYGSFGERQFSEAPQRMYHSSPDRAAVL